MIAPIALRVDVPHDKTPLALAKHSSLTLARRIDTAVQLHYAGTTFLIQPYEQCKADCSYCLAATERELSWEAA